MLGRGTCCGLPIMGFCGTVNIFSAIGKRSTVVNWVVIIIKANKWRRLREVSTMNCEICVCFDNELFELRIFIFMDKKDTRIVVKGGLV
jgi:hypothetical protein